MHSAENRARCPLNVSATKISLAIVKLARKITWIVNGTGILSIVIRSPLSNLLLQALKVSGSICIANSVWEDIINKWVSITRILSLDWMLLFEGPVPVVRCRKCNFNYDSNAVCKTWLEGSNLSFIETRLLDPKNIKMYQRPRVADDNSMCEHTSSNWSPHNALTHGLIPPVPKLIRVRPNRSPNFVSNTAKTACPAQQMMSNICSIHDRSTQLQQARCVAGSSVR